MGWQKAKKLVRDPKRPGRRASGERHPKNKTDIAGFDKVAADPRVIEVYSEGSDGYWIDLVRGWNIEGCNAAHGYTVKETLEHFSMIEEGDCY